MRRPRIILADDHRVFADGLKSLLDDDFDVIRIVEDGPTLLQAVEELDPDLVITDISMPGLNGIECVRQLHDSAPEVRVVLLTMYDDLGFATSAIKAGASGYVLKNSGVKDLLLAVSEALRGGVHVSPLIASDVMRALASGDDTGSQLTPRQLEIMRHLVDGLSAKEIASLLHISPRTVEFHKYQAMARIGVDTSAELIAYTLKRVIGPV